MKGALQTIPVQAGKSEVVVQISSIATMGPTDNWLRNTFLDALSANEGLCAQKPDFKVIFPTPDEIRRSLDGYRSGGSIHTKIQSPQQAKQLQYLKPILHHWANDAPSGDGKSPVFLSRYMRMVILANRSALADDSCVIQEAGRKRAAPHIKTYIRYGAESIDWALMTSANLSKQAWGEAVGSSGELRISSYEIGVLVWPSLFGEGARMVGTFCSDVPGAQESGHGKPVVGLRVPYNLPLQRYGRNEIPWVATASYSEPDWMGQIWSG
jgi:tyrosyl-DNA phosphodiesterase-1